MRIDLQLERAGPGQGMGIVLGMAWIAAMHVCIAWLVPVFTPMKTEVMGQFYIYCMVTSVLFMGALCVFEKLKKSGSLDKSVLTSLLIAMFAVHMAALFVFQTSTEAWAWFPLRTLERKTQQFALVMAPVIFLLVLLQPYLWLRTLSLTSGKPEAVVGGQRKTLHTSSGFGKR
jgi:hypothetical protein